MQCIQCVRNSATAKFDETFEVTANLGIDPKKTNQILRGSLMVLRCCANMIFSFLMEMENTLELQSLPMDNTPKRLKMLGPILSVLMI